MQFVNRLKSLFVPINGSNYVQSGDGIINGADYNRCSRGWARTIVYSVENGLKSFIKRFGLTYWGWVFEPINPSRLEILSMNSLKIN
jgi:hypothetical protein